MTETEKVNYDTQFMDLKKRLVLAKERGEDITPILTERKQLQVKIADEAASKEADKIVTERQALRDQASAIVSKCRIQGEAIDAFLKERDSIISELTPIVKRAMGLPALQEACYSQFRNPMEIPFIKKLPAGYLPPDIKVPMIVSVNGEIDPTNSSILGITSLRVGLGWLTNMKRQDTSLEQRQGTEFEVIDPQPAAKPSLMTTGETETEGEANIITCCVCQHPQNKEINADLKAGALSLRDIEAKYPGISRSSLSRHDQHHLKHIIS